MHIKSNFAYKTYMKLIFIKHPECQLLNEIKITVYSLQHL